MCGWAAKLRCSRVSDGRQFLLDAVRFRDVFWPRFRCSHHDRHLQIAGAAAPQNLLGVYTAAARLYAELVAMDAGPAHGMAFDMDGIRCEASAHQLVLS